MRRGRTACWMALLAALTSAVSVPALAAQACRASRLGLVIGNAAYPDNEAALQEPVGNARAMAAALKQIGFATTEAEDLTGDQMQSALNALEDKITPDAVVFLFFSGYGIQSGGHTYLIPVDAKIWSEADVRTFGISLDRILSDFTSHGAAVKIVVADAARRNPFERRFRLSGSAGLAAVKGTPGVLALFSAAPGATFGEGTNPTSAVVDALVKRMGKAGAMAEDTFRRARVDVSHTAGAGTTPWVSSFLPEDIALNERDCATAPLATAAGAAPDPARQTSARPSPPAAASAPTAVAPASPPPAAPVRQQPPAGRLPPPTTVPQSAAPAPIAPQPSITAPRPAPQPAMPVEQTAVPPPASQSVAAAPSAPPAPPRSSLVARQAAPLRPAPAEPTTVAGAPPAAPEVAPAQPVTPTPSKAPVPSRQATAVPDISDGDAANQARRPPAVVASGTDATIDDAAQLDEIKDRLFEQNLEPGEPGTPAMATAIRTFEDRTGLPPDGRPTPRFLRSLREAHSLKPWGAITFAPAAKTWGMSWGSASRREALAVARARCGSDQCVNQSSFFGHGCGAFSLSPQSWSITWRNGEVQARQAALDGCGQRGSACRIIGAVCADGSGRVP